MEKYRAPENYLKDETSGLYYKEMQLQDQYNHELRHIIWFNAETGEYKQVSYPVSSVKSHHERASNKRARNSQNHTKKMVIVLIIIVLLGAGFVILRGLSLGNEPVLTSEEMVEQYGIDSIENTTMSFEVYDGTVNQDNVIAGYEEEGEQ